MDEKTRVQICRDAFAEGLAQAVKNRQALLLALLAMLASIDLFFSLFEPGSLLSGSADRFTTVLEQHPFMLLAGIIFCAALYVFLKSAVLLSLNTSIMRKRRSTGTIIATAGSFFTSYLTFELIIILGLSAIFLVLSIPGTLASDNAALSQNLSLLAVIAFIPIFVIGSIMDTYGSFYLLFTKVGPKAALELGYSLFVRRLADTFAFGGLYLLTFLAFSTVLGSILQVLMTAFQGTMSRLTVAIVLFYLAEASFFTFSKAAWIAFFRTIAKGKPEAATLQTEENVIEKSVAELDRKGEGA